MPPPASVSATLGPCSLVGPAPSWTHQRAVRESMLLLAPYVRDHAIGDAMISPADVVFGPRNMVEPDLFVVPLVGGRVPKGWQDVGRLLLTAEVLSPSSGRTDRGEKLDPYKRKRVPEYWIVDVDARVVERWQLDDTEPERLTASLEWRPDPATPALVIDLPAYFARVTGEPAS
jgi:Uma2 family endonuclease